MDSRQKGLALQGKEQHVERHRGVEQHIFISSTWLGKQQAGWSEERKLARKAGCKLQRACSHAKEQLLLLMMGPSEISKQGSDMFIVFLVLVRKRAWKRTRVTARGHGPETPIFQFLYHPRMPALFHLGLELAGLTPVLGAAFHLGFWLMSLRTRIVPQASVDLLPCTSSAHLCVSFFGWLVDFVFNESLSLLKVPLMMGLDDYIRFLFSLWLFQTEPKVKIPVLLWVS